MAKSLNIPSILIGLGAGMLLANMWRSNAAGVGNAGIAGRERYSFVRWLRSNLKGKVSDWYERAPNKDREYWFVAFDKITETVTSGRNGVQRRWNTITYGIYIYPYDQADVFTFNPTNKKEDYNQYTLQDYAGRVVSNEVNGGKINPNGILIRVNSYKAEGIAKHYLTETLLKS